jgi:LEA14-like dessication related protein
MEIVVYVLALIGLAYIVKHLKHHEGCLLCDWEKPKVEGVKTKAGEAKEKVEKVKTKMEEVKPKVEELKTKVGGLKTKEEGEKRTGSRYGSNPVSY